MRRPTHGRTPRGLQTLSVDTVDWVDSRAPGYPRPFVPRDETATALRKRTLTNLHNDRPLWCPNVYAAPDAAVTIEASVLVASCTTRSRRFTTEAV